ncbi:MAG: tail fiber domain-containing protein, partial [Bacteroidota bacterium]
AGSLMTSAQRTAINDPANGLMVYQTDQSPGLYSFDGSKWIAVGSNVPSGQLTTPAPSTWTTVQDASQEVAGESDDYSSLGTSKWQSFTAVNSGMLQQIDLLFSDANVVFGPKITIYAGEGTNQTPLYSHTYDASLWGWHSYPINGSVPVVAGTLYTIEVQDNFADWSYHRLTDIYTGGRASITNVVPNADFVFRTFVLPEVVLSSVNANTVGFINDAIHVDQIGNVGLGTNTPKNKLDVEGGLAIGSAYSGTEMAPTNGAIIEGNVGLGTLTPKNKLDIEGGVAVGSTYSGTNTAPTNGAIIEGNVGIGTNNPTKGRLEVVGSTAPFTQPAFRWVRKGFNEQEIETGTFDFSIYCTGNIGSTSYLAFSDARIKKQLRLSNSQQDLSTLMAIAITDYQHIDTIQRGSEIHKKVIAQQVAEVYPQAVTNSTREIIPDIYQRATVKDGWIQLATDLQVGERVKIITEAGSQIYEVTTVEAHRFQVTPLSTDHSALTTANVFVYGREVDDFHVVDYEAISMLNVSATQELARQIDRLRQENKQLWQDNKQLRAHNQQFENRLGKLEATLGRRFVEATKR